MIFIPKGKTIDLDMTPQRAMPSGEIRSQEDYERLQRWIATFEDLAYPFVDCWDSHATFVFMVFNKEGNSSWVESVSDQDREALGITEDMLLDSIKAAGGNLNISGHYPINLEIRSKLMRAFPS
jgi:hypothetical protein